MSHTTLEFQVDDVCLPNGVPAAPCPQVQGPLRPLGGELGRPQGVLVIEDEPALRKALERSLRKRGFAVWVAPDGGEGVDLYRRFWAQIDVVLSDVRMPVLDGPRTLDALREINPSVRCCFMTGDTGVSSLAALRKRGALRVFTKPFPSAAEVAEELRELATRPPDLSATPEFTGEETASARDVR